MAGVHNASKLGDRLKPPPDVINFERKKIRLNSTSNGYEKSDSSKDVLNKIIVNEHKRQSVESRNDCKSYDSHSDVSKAKPEVKETKKIVLKRNHLSVQVSNSLL